jgi:hypothetical protein
LFMGRTLYVDDDTVRGELRALVRTHVCEVAEVPPPPTRTGPEWTISCQNWTHIFLRRNTANPQDPDCRDRFVVGFQIGPAAPWEWEYQTIGDVITEVKSWFNERVPTQQTDQAFRMARATYTRPLAACAGRRVVPFWTVNNGQGGI